MEQIEIFEIPSPCKGICQVNNRGYCLGCYRSREERFDWNTYSNNEKKRVIELCQQRYKRYLQRKKQLQEQADSDAAQQSFDL